MMTFQNFFIVLFLAHGAYGSHFLGGSMSWKPINHDTQIELAYRVGYRLNPQVQAKFDPCSQSAKDDRIPLEGGGDLVCNDCTGKDLKKEFTWICDDFDEMLDTAVGGNKTVYDIPDGKTAYDISFKGCCWIKLKSPVNPASLNKYLRGWNLMTHINVQYRTDIRGINSSPKTAAIPAQKYRGGCTYTLKIIVSDPDDDPVQCRNYKTEECNQEEIASCGVNTTGLQVMSNCTLVFNAGEAGEGYHAGNIMIEDCEDTTCQSHYSKVPLLFLLNVVGDSCVSKPNIMMPKQCNIVSPGDTFEIKIKAETEDVSFPISQIMSYDKPFAMKEGQLAQSRSNPKRKSKVYTWKTTADDEGYHPLCFSALDSERFTSDIECIVVTVTAESNPRVTVDKENSIPAEGVNHQLIISDPWMISFTGNIQRPTEDVFIRIVDLDSDQDLYAFNGKDSQELTYTGNSIVIRMIEDNFPIFPGYSMLPIRIKLDDGVAVSSDKGCSLPIAATEWDVILEVISVVEPARKECPADSPPRKFSECDDVYAQTTLNKYGEPVATGKYKCCSCSCISAPSDQSGPPGYRSPGYLPGPPGSR